LLSIPTSSRKLALKEWRCYLEECTGEFEIDTDHEPLVYLANQPMLSRKQARGFHVSNTWNFPLWNDSTLSTLGKFPPIFCSRPNVTLGSGVPETRNALPYAPMAPGLVQAALNVQHPRRRSWSQMATPSRVASCSPSIIPSVAGTRGSNARSTLSAVITDGLRCALMLTIPFDPVIRANR